MSQSTEARNKAIVLETFDTLFNKRNYGAAARFWTPSYVQHSAHIESRSRWPLQSNQEHAADVQARARTGCGGWRSRDWHSRFSGFGQTKNWIVADFVRVVDGLLIEHWDVVEDEASQAESKSGRPMFGDRFPG